MNIDIWEKVTSIDVDVCKNREVKMPITVRCSYPHLDIHLTKGDAEKLYKGLEYVLKELDPQWGMHLKEVMQAGK